MTRRIGLLTSSLLLVLVAGATARAQTADEIVARNLEAKGGLARIRAVQTIKQTSAVTISGLPGTIVVYDKRPNLSRQELTVTVQGKTMTSINAFDGTTVWGINPLSGIDTPTVATGEQAAEIKRQADFDGPFIDAKAKGYTITLVGTETLGPESVYHLHVTDKEGHETQIYLDTKTALEVKVVRQVATMGEVAQTLSDYRDVRTTVTGRNPTTGEPITQEVAMTVQKVEFNLPFEDSLFKMPGKE
jgi:hypothetical protein